MQIKILQWPNGLGLAALYLSSINFVGRLTFRRLIMFLCSFIYFIAYQTVLSLFIIIFIASDSSPFRSYSGNLWGVGPSGFGKRMGCSENQPNHLHHNNSGKKVWNIKIKCNEKFSEIPKKAKRKFLDGPKINPCVRCQCTQREGAPSPSPPPVYNYYYVT